MDGTHMFNFYMFKSCHSPFGEKGDSLVILWGKDPIGFNKFPIIDKHLNICFIN